MALQTRETALQNEVVRLYCQFMYNGALANPAAQPLVEILGADGSTILDTVAAQMEYNGIYYVDWFVPQNLPLGTYYDRWTFQWSAMSSIETLTMPINVRSFDNYIEFVSNGVSHQLSGRSIQMVKDLENWLIYEATHIPIYWEQGMRTQQEDQQKRVKNYYYFTVDNNEQYVAEEGDIYFNNGQKFTVFKSLNTADFYSSSSSGSSSSSLTEQPMSSSSSWSQSSISATSLSSLSSPSSVSSLSSWSSHSSISSDTISSSSSVTEDPLPVIVLSCVGTGTPLASGTLVKVVGNGVQNINYTSFTSKRSRFSTIYSFAYRNWVRDFKPIVRVNQRIVDDGWYTDYDGKIYFDRLMTPEDVVEVTYKFSCFSLEQMLGFLRAGLMMMNAIPPSSSTYSNVDFMPYEWMAPVMLYASVQALRRAIMGMNFQEKRAIYGGAGNDEWAQQALSAMQNLYQEYNNQWTEMSKNAKTRKLPSIAMYVTPEYTLPGGRSRWFRYLYKNGA